LVEITIDKNESDQRLDRFLKKYLANAPQSFIYKMIRKKRIKINNKKANPESLIMEGDAIQLYISDETLEKFIQEKKEIVSSALKGIIYEDENIILINKPKGVLSHPAEKDYEYNIVDSMVSYLHQKGEYNPRVEKTFVPSICNRLDRNTSGIIIGAKNYATLKEINEAIRRGDIKKYYKCIVKGKVEKDILLKGYIVKDERKNRVKVYKNDVESSKAITTYVKVLKSKDKCSLLEIDLITGRTHQIRAHLSSIGHPVIGDTKYGDKSINDFFRKKYDLKSQYLHAYKIVFNGLDSPLNYLNGREFVANIGTSLERIEKEWFD